MKPMSLFHESLLPQANSRGRRWVRGDVSRKIRGVVVEKVEEVGVGALWHRSRKI